MSPPEGRSEDPSEELLALAVEVAHEAGALLREFADGRALRVETKTSATDPVSEADRASEDLIARRLLTARPDDGMLGEEDAANRAGTSGVRWVVDPLDGTVNYLYGIPQWCVSIAAEDADGGLVGVVFDPSRDETFAARRGGGATRNGAAITVSEVTDPAHMLMSTGFAYDPVVRAEQGVMAADLLTRVRDLRRGGAAAIDLAWTACGRHDGYAEFGLQPWDWAAGGLLITEAGGRVSTRERSFDGATKPGLVAGGAHAHDVLAAWLDDHPAG